MNRLSFTKGTMLFNERVLSFGSVRTGTSYTLRELKNKIFFNRIFIDNMNELFQKYPCFDIIEDYTHGLDQYVQNMDMILAHIDHEYPGINIERRPSFERDLATEINMRDQLISDYYPDIESIKKRFKGLNNVIYYVSLLDNDYIAISYVDPRKAMYQKILCQEINGIMTYWKADDCILSYVETLHHEGRRSKTIMMKLTTSLNTDSITKVEYTGRPEVMKTILGLFNEETLVVHNPYLYTDDIQRVLDSRIQNEPVPTPKYDSLTWGKIFERDILIEYPTTSFDVYLQLLRLATLDNKVKSIHLTLYRIGNDPVLYNIIRDAIANNIKVHVNIELRATGEEINKFWVNEMRKIGAEVTTYANGYHKVHSKITLINFKDGRQIAQIGTGNYHSQTVTQYTDLSLITTQENICSQIQYLFDILRGVDTKERKFDYSLLVTQHNARRMLCALIREQGELGDKGYIGIKCNSLNDVEIENYLAEAASRGCRIDLIVRGVCSWIPYQYLEHNVTVKSIVWDKLEHSRVYCFGSKNPIVYIGSLDPTEKKLDDRIETLVSIQDPKILKQICGYLNTYITNTRNSWIMESNGPNHVEYIKEG